MYIQMIAQIIEDKINELETSNIEKETFINNLTHELKKNFNLNNWISNLRIKLIIRMCFRTRNSIYFCETII